MYKLAVILFSTIITACCTSRLKYCVYDDIRKTATDTIYIIATNGYAADISSLREVRKSKNVYVCDFFMLSNITILR